MAEAELVGRWFVLHSHAVCAPYGALLLWNNAIWIKGDKTMASFSPKAPPQGIPTKSLKGTHRMLVHFPHTAASQNLKIADVDDIAL